MTATSDLFDGVDALPDAGAAERYRQLVGLDKVKDRLLKESRLLLERDALVAWSHEHHGHEIAAVAAFGQRRPLFVFAGDVGTGKTELAETYGDAVARETKRDVLLFRLSLAARGTGAVGEMTRLISSAFDAVEAEIPAGGNPRIAGVLLIDEADALAQSRAITQMHHEDRAGVNALIRRIDRVSADGRPVITILCTNRLDAIDPAVRRRAAAEFEFPRPDDEQRGAVMAAALAGTNITAAQMEELVELTGPRDGREYCHSYSDLRMRVIPAAVLAAFPSRRLSFDDVRQAIIENPPTKPFSTERGE